MSKAASIGKFKTRTWIIIIAALAVAAAVGAVMIAAIDRSTVAEVILDGEVIEEIDLALVTKEYSFTVEVPEGGSNTVTVRPGGICVSSADCPDKICVSHGWLSDGADAIVCMPHKLIIRLKNAGSVDAEVK